MFKKRNAESQTMAFKKMIDVYNYVPIEYRPTKRWLLFSDPASFRKVHENRLASLAIDEFCGDIFDAEIEAEAELMKSSARDQREHHIYVARVHAEIARGEVSRLNDEKNAVLGDIEKIKEEIAKYKALKGGA